MESKPAKSGQNHPATRESAGRGRRYMCTVLRHADPGRHPPGPGRVPTVPVHVFWSGPDSRSAFGGIDHLCCGKAFETKGLYVQAAYKIAEMEAALRTASAAPHPVRHQPLPGADAKRKSGALSCSNPIFASSDFLLPASHAGAAAHRPASDLLHPAHGPDRALGRSGPASEQVVLPQGILCCGFRGQGF